MPQAQGNVFDRFNDTLKNLDGQLQELRDRFDDQRKKVEGQVGQQREKLESQIRESALYRRGEQVAQDVGEQLERGRAQLFEVFGIASKSEIDKINRKLNRISKRLNEFAKQEPEI